jgi:hypothetical protein
VPGGRILPGGGTLVVFDGIVENVNPDLVTRLEKDSRLRPLRPEAIAI